MSYAKISQYMVGAFIGALGLFNSSKLELRQEVNTNAELLFQNGQIISASVICVCIAGILGEIWFMKEMKKCPPKKDLVRVMNQEKIKKSKRKEDKKVNEEKVAKGDGKNEKE